MRIAVVGNYQWPHYQQALLDGFHSQEETRNAIPIKLKYYPTWNIFGVIVNTFKLYVNHKRFRPDTLFLYRVDAIFPFVIYYIKKIYKTNILVYHNDDPYKQTFYRRLKHYFFLRSLRYSDITYVYRDVNIDEAKEMSAPRVRLLRAYYYSKLDQLKCQPDYFNKKTKQLVFIGHIENDSRVTYLDSLFRANINVHVYGGDSWRNTFVKFHWPMDHLHDAVFGMEYRRCLNSAYSALSFFSEKNRDDYTRRCFEIPMAHTLLLAPRTEYMDKTFKDGINALLFSNTEELVEKARSLLETPERTREITEEGYRFVLNGGFSEVDAAKMIISDIKNIR